MIQEVSEEEVADSGSILARYLAEARYLCYLRADSEGTILACNGAWGELLDLPPSRLAGQPLWSHLPEADAEQLRLRVRKGAGLSDRFLLNVCDSANLPHTLQCLLDVRPDGFVLLAEPTHAESRRLERELLALNDELSVLARERERLLESERRARTEAERANRIKDDFLGMVSHDLRNPLGTILHWAELLEMGRLDEAGTRKAIQAIQRNVRTQVKLVDDLLDATRITAGTMRVSLQTASLAAILDAALEAVRPAAERKRITLVKAGDADPGLLRADPGRLEQALVNLLSNAVAYTPEEGRVEVSLERDGSRVCIRVTDTGVGIDSDLLPHLFEPFRQGARARKGRSSGLGLGLAITRQIVKLHGGTIEAESPGPGQGSTFTIRLPAAGPP